MDIDNEFVEKYRGLVRDRIAAHKIYDLELRDLIESRVWERVIGSNGYDPKKGAISTWLYNICRSVVSHELARKARSTDLLDQADNLSLDEAKHYIGEEDAGTPADELDRIFKKTTSVSKRDRKMLKLAHLEGYTHKEIADKFDVSEAAVQKATHRALLALQATAQAEE